MSSKSMFRVIALLAVSALLVPAAAGAKQGQGKSQGKGQANAKSKSKSKGKAKGKSKQRKNPTVTYVFKGTISAIDATAKTATVNVTRTNKHGRSYKGQEVGFDLSSAKVSTADVNADTSEDLADFAVGNAVSVKVRMPKRGAGDPPFTARQIVNRTNPETEETPES